MINPTGLIKTDLLILDIFGKILLANFQKKMGKYFKNSWCSRWNFYEIKKFF